MTPRWRLVLLIGLALAGIVAVCTRPLIPQDLAYHRFADTRPLAGLASFLDVFSNAPFAVIGVLGLLRLGQRPLPDRWQHRVFAVLFFGVALTAFGSGWYHLAPDNARLFWDRLPMTIVFTAFFALLLADRVDGRAARLLFPVLLAGGVASVAWWRWVDDLRPYVLVQFVPMMLTPVLLLLFPGKVGDSGLVWRVLGWYALAKVAELLDAPIYQLGGIVSGHTLKHLFGGVATVSMLGVMALRASRRG